MDLLKDIDERAKTLDLELFLEALAELDADMEDETVVKAVHDEIQYLKEIGRGDYAAHMDMAKGHGVRGHEADPRVQGALASKFSIRPKEQAQAAPQEGQRVVFVGPGNQRFGFTVVSAFEDMVTLKSKDGKRFKVDMQQMKAARDKRGGMGWVTRKMPQALQHSAIASANRPRA